MVSYLLTGPESTGKSYLSKELAKHFGGSWVKEYARDYIEKLDSPYTFNDVELIARQQISDYIIEKNRHEKFEPVFFDTFLIITKIWFEEVFKCCPAWLNKTILTYKIDFALLCAPDLPWVADGVRENPDLRDYLFNRYRDELDFYQIPFAIIEGKGQNRLNNAIRVVEKHLHILYNHPNRKCRL